MNKFNKHIIIAGSARSGTSWLAEVISKTFRYRLLFEPDHEDHVLGAKVLSDKYIIEQQENWELNLFLNKVFKNRFDNDWIAQNSNRKYKMHLWPFLPKMYIIKLIRSNLAVKFINQTYNIPIIHIIRNPYDVIFSQNRVKFPWLYNLSYFREQEELVSLIKDKTGFDISRNDFSDIEKLAIRWCIENVVPLQFQAPYVNKATIVKYEDLKDNLDAFYELVNRFNLELPPNIDEIYNRPSSKTHPKSTIRAVNEESNFLDDKDYSEVKNILETFQVSLYKV